MVRLGRGYPQQRIAPRAAFDPSWASVVALLHCDGANGSTTFTDSSNLAANFTGTNATISTTQSKFGGASISMGSTSNVAASAAGSNFTFGTSDFTIEFWAYTSTSSQTVTIYDHRPSGTNGLYPTIILNSGTLFYLVSGALKITGTSLSINTWHHIAVSRIGSSTKMFMDGTQVGSTYTDSNNYLNGTSRPCLENGNASSQNFVGFIDEVRITKGVGRYSGSFTAPTAAFPNQ